MMRYDTALKKKLQQNALTIGSWITIGHTSIVEIMASAGFDWLTIDLEHSAMDFEKSLAMISQVQGCGLPVLVRVAENDPNFIKRVMDAGANGVIVPMVNSAADAAAAVAAVKYPPAGKRGVGLARAQGYGQRFDDYLQWLNESSVVIAQVEHIDSVRNIDDILRVEGIDGIMIGPYDLSASMGIPGKYELPEVTEAIRKVETACKKHGKPLGFHVIKADHRAAIDKISNGYNFIAFSIDFMLLGEKVRSEMDEIRKSTGK